MFADGLLRSACSAEKLAEEIAEACATAGTEPQIRSVESNAEVNNRCMTFLSDEAV